MTSRTRECVVIGAGPYGLSATAHLRKAQIEVQTFGRAMEFWKRQMPSRMLLRSSWDASQIASPGDSLTLEAYQRSHGIALSKPIPIGGFIAYAEWFQQTVVPDLDTRQIVSVDRASQGFRLLLDDNEEILTRRVLVAAGISPFSYRPPQFDGLPADLASHSVDHDNLDHFAGRRVVVVGSGQSAIESAAILHEAGAEVEVVARASRIRWLRRSGWLHNHVPAVRRLLYHPTDVGPPGLNQITARPDLFTSFPMPLQRRMAYRSIRPAAAGWLWSRIRNVRVTTGRMIVSAVPKDGGLSLSLDDETTRQVDHAFLSTGFRIDVARYPFLSEQLKRQVQCVQGYPSLSRGFESSVPGLHFLGAPAAWSYGPLMRFVSGTTYTSRLLVRSLAPGVAHLNGREIHEPGVSQSSGLAGRELATSASANRGAGNRR